MLKIRKYLSILFVALLLPSCGDGKEASTAVAAYDAAVEKVMLAGSSEELIEVSYSLHLELAALASVADSRKVNEARQRFEKAVKEKEIEFYAVVRRKK